MALVTEDYFMKKFSYPFQENCLFPEEVRILHQSIFSFHRQEINLATKK